MYINNLKPLTNYDIIKIADELKIKDQFSISFEKILGKVTSTKRNNNNSSKRKAV